MKNTVFIPGFLWAILTLICLVVILTAFQSVLKKAGWNKKHKQKIFIGTIAALSLWIGLLSVLSLKSFFSDFNRLPPRPLFAMMGPLPFIIAIAFSKKGMELLKLIPRQWLVFMQSFRIFVEFLIWFAFLAGKLPVQMTFEGGNIDLLTGILALPVGYYLLKKTKYSSKLAIGFNILGIVFLLNILVIAVISMPGPLRYFMNEPSNSLVAQFPFILLPGVLVPIAYSMHIFSLRQLLLEKKTASLVAG